MNVRAKHILGVVAVAATGALIEVFGPSGPWAHAMWAPIAIGLLTNLRKAIDGSIL